jgi:hypothetical protein
VTHARPLSDPANPPGATPVGGGNRGGGRKKGLLLGAALLAVLLLAALLLSQCGTDDPRTSSDGADQTSGDAGSSASSSADGDSAPSSAGGGSAAGGAGSGQIVTADGESVLDLVAQPDPTAALGALAGQPVTGTGVQVLSVPADEGFWVGTSDQQRVWVQLTGEAGESPYQVTEGDTVDFEGTVVAHDEAFAGEVGVDEAEGAELLATQATHLEVAKSAVTLAA